MKLFKVLMIAIITVVTTGAAMAQQVVVRAHVGPRHHHHVYHHHVYHHHYRHHR